MNDTESSANALEIDYVDLPVTAGLIQRCLHSLHFLLAKEQSMGRTAIVALPIDPGIFYKPFTTGPAIGTWIPSPYIATPGMLTGKCPVIAISPKSAFARAISEVGVGL